MKYLKFGFYVCLLVFSGQASEVSASTWTCQKGKFTREVIVIYPKAPARLPCKVFYAKQNENVMPRVLWEAENTKNYCQHKAEKFIEKLTAAGWRCNQDAPDEKPNNQ